MMDRDIVNLIRNHKQYEAEIMIMRDCSDELTELESSTRPHRYALLKRRLDLSGHWLHLLPEEEGFVVRKRLIEGWAWLRIATEVDEKYRNEKEPCDVRALQRALEKAVKRIVDFMNDNFADSLDFLVEYEG